MINAWWVFMRLAVYFGGLVFVSLADCIVDMLHIA